jgi:hypothetical protein
MHNTDGHPVYETTPVRGNGLGMIATLAIPRGTRIYSETHLFTLPSSVDDFSIAELLALSKVKRLSKD